MSDDNEIEKPLGSGDDHDDDDDVLSGDAEAGDLVFHVDRSVSKESPVEHALKLFVLAYLALLLTALTALTFRIFERRS
ncbi:MAG: hypothetical protein ACXWQ5_00805 [Ktedonobacterales bacterium]